MRKENKQASQQKKERLLIAALSIVAVIMLIFCINAAKKEPEPSQPSVAGTTTTAATTTAPTTTATTTASVTEQTTEPSTEGTTAQPEATTTAVPETDEAEEALRVITESMALIKSDKANFKGHKVQNIDIKLVDSSMPSMNDFVNGIIKAFVKQEVYDYDFTNGVSEDPENGGTSKSDSIFPPGDIAFSLKKEGVASAEIRKEGENTVYSVTLVAETSTLENPRPPHHNSAADTLDLSSVEIPLATITKADFEYPGATVAVTLDGDGKIVGYYERLPMSGTGEAKALGLSGYGTIEGYLEENWDIQWK